MAPGGPGSKALCERAALRISSLYEQVRLRAHVAGHHPPPPPHTAQPAVPWGMDFTPAPVTSFPVTHLNDDNLIFRLIRPVSYLNESLR